MKHKQKEKNHSKSDLQLTMGTKNAFVLLLFNLNFQ